MAANYVKGDYIPSPAWFDAIDEGVRAELIDHLRAQTKNFKEDVPPGSYKFTEQHGLSKERTNVLVAFCKQSEEGNDRPRTDVTCPPPKALASKLLFKSGGGINVSVLKEHLTKEGRLEKQDCIKIAGDAGKVMHEEPNLLRLKDPITVVGDIHGQFFDLLRCFKVGGEPGQTSYLFLGDYVDRGCFASEVVMYLFSLKITFPKNIYMLRGNHESRHLTAFFNFKDECIYKYDLDVYDAIMDAFDNLPLSATVNDQFLCMHGGLSPDIRYLREIDEINRFQEVPREGPFCDLLWADPVNEEEQQENQEDNDFYDWFFENEVRQCSYKYGTKAANFFLQKNNLTAIIRAHEVFPDGYKMHFLNKKTKVPRVFTIFSAPNYCDVYRNKGACLKITDNTLNIRQYVWSAHPYYLPNFMDVFVWSLPFVAEKATSMLHSILNQAEKEASGKSKSVVASDSSDMKEKSQILKNKVLAVTKMMNLFKLLREEQQNVVTLKQLSPSKKLPNGILAKGPEAIKDAISNFSKTKAADRINDAYPHLDEKGEMMMKRSQSRGTRFSLMETEDLDGLLREDLELAASPTVHIIEDVDIEKKS